MNTRILKDNCKLGINVDYYLSKYNGIKKICDELGIEYINGNQADAEKIKEDFYRVYKKYGHINKEFYSKHGKYSNACIRTAFGGYNNLMKELGIPLNMVKKVTKEEVIEDIKKIYAKYHTTQSAQYRKYGSYVESTIMNLFGTWGEAVKASGIEYVPIKEYGKEYMLKELKRVYEEHGYLTATLISHECEFTYEAAAWQFGKNHGIAEAIGYPQAFSVGHTSTKATLLKNILNKMFERVEVEYSWDWLRNDHTGKRMYVDFYIPEINYVFEYDGEQHERYTKFIHDTEEAFRETQYRDRLKNILLYEHGVKLIRLYYNEKITKEHIEELLKL